MNKRKRNRKSKSHAKSDKTTKSRPAKASDYLHRLREYHRKNPDMVAILYNRESTHQQEPNHYTHKKVLLRKCKKRNITSKGFYHETCTGKIQLNADRKELRHAVRKARAMIKKGKHAVILATSSDRFLRNIDYHPKDNFDVKPSAAEYEKLQKLTRCVPLVTFLHPDMPWKEVRSYHTKWGQRAKNKKGGRPILKRPGYKKKRRENKLPRVRKLFRKGKSVTEIARKVVVPRQTISDWIDNYI